MDISWNLTFWIILEVLHSWQSQNFHVLDNWKIYISFIWTIPELLYYGLFQRSYLLDHFITLIFLIVPEFLHSWPFQNVYLLDHSRIFTFWTIPEFLHSGAFNHIFKKIQEFLYFGPFKNSYNQDHSINKKKKVLEWSFGHSWKLFFFDFCHFNGA